MKKPPTQHTDDASIHQMHVEREQNEAAMAFFLDQREREVWLAEREANLVQDRAFQRDCDRRLAENIAWRKQMGIVLPTDK